MNGRTIGTWQLRSSTTRSVDDQNRTKSSTLVLSASGNLAVTMVAVVPLSPQRALDACARRRVLAFRANVTGMSHTAHLNGSTVHASIHAS